MGMIQNKQKISFLEKKGNLTPREKKILTLVASGYSDKIISDRLQISPNTVKTHIRRTLVKLEAANRSEAVARASALGLISPVDQ